jgi:hypothetical protein
MTCTGSSRVSAHPDGCSAIPNGIPSDLTLAVCGGDHGRPRTAQAMRLRRPCTTCPLRARELGRQFIQQG